jgi:hypothetical protein
LLAFVFFLPFLLPLGLGHVNAEECREPECAAESHGTAARGSEDQRSSEVVDVLMIHDRISATQAPRACQQTVMTSGGASPPWVAT